jgi:hypothetical protein
MHTNVILLTVPYRHDLECLNIILNDELRNLNRKLLKLKKLFPHLSVVEINETRHWYTKQGLHLNNLGKEILSFNLVLHIFSLIEKENNFHTNVIALRYYEVQPRTISSSVNQPFPLTSVEIIENTSVKCIRKKPVTKMNDFFMGNLSLTTKCCNSGQTSAIHSIDLNKCSKSSVIHQNIRALRYKIDELLSLLYPDFPHIIGITEHHLNYTDLSSIVIENYTLGASYCRRPALKGGTCIFLRNRLNYVIKIETDCSDFDIELFSIKIQSNSSYIRSL